MFHRPITTWRPTLSLRLPYILEIRSQRRKLRWRKAPTTSGCHSCFPYAQCNSSSSQTGLRVFRRWQPRTFEAPYGPEEGPSLQYIIPLRYRTTTHWHEYEWYQLYHCFISYLQHWFWSWALCHIQDLPSSVSSCLSKKRGGVLFIWRRQHIWASTFHHFLIPPSLVFRDSQLRRPRENPRGWRHSRKLHDTTHHASRCIAN